MYLNYKAKSEDKGIKLRAVADWDLILSDVKGEKTATKTVLVEASIIKDGVNVIYKNTLSLLLHKDKTGHHYFHWFGEKIYVSDFEYLKLDDLMEKIDNGEVISLDMFAASIFKNINNIMFVDQTRDKDSLYLPQKLDHANKSWSYNIESIPAFENELPLSYCSTIQDYYFGFGEGFLGIVSKNKVHVYETKKKKKA